MRVVLNIIWLVPAGLWLAVGYAFAGLIMVILIITIPFGLQRGCHATPQHRP